MDMEHIAYSSRTLTEDEAEEFTRRLFPPLRERIYAERQRRAAEVDAAKQRRLARLREMIDVRPSVARSMR
jgi:hypothetical protein